MRRGGFEGPHADRLRGVMDRQELHGVLRGALRLAEKSMMV